MDKQLADISFAIRCTIVTICVCVILSLFMPTYQFIDDSHRVNIVSGVSECKDFYKNWR